mgnify:CR=1 FL=1
MLFKVSPHIAVSGTVSKLGKVRKTLIDRRTTRHDGSTTSLRFQKRIEQTTLLQRRSSIATGQKLIE